MATAYILVTTCIGKEGVVAQKVSGRDGVKVEILFPGWFNLLITIQGRDLDGKVLAIIERLRSSQFVCCYKRMFVTETFEVVEQIAGDQT